MLQILPQSRSYRFILLLVFAERSSLLLTRRFVSLIFCQEARPKGGCTIACDYYQYRREPILTYAFAGTLLAFKYASPSLEPLFALPPTWRPRPFATYSKK